MDKKNIKKIIPAEKHKISELEQEIEIKNEYITSLEKKNNKEKSQTFTRHWQRELEQENQMFKELVESLEGKTSSDIREFFSMISHELKTPLVPIQTYVKLLKEEHYGDLDKTQKEKLGIVDFNATALSEMVQSMLDYQKLASGSMEMNKEETNIGKIVKDAFTALDSKFKQNEIETLVSIDRDIKLKCDKQRILQVLINLLDNSIKAIQSKFGKINVRVSQLKNKIMISVNDNGCGIPTEQIDKVFSKFYQVDMSNTREKGGVGLGLSICQIIIKAHDGEIWIESEFGKGTTINFTLPKK